MNLKLFCCSASDQRHGREFPVVKMTLLLDAFPKKSGFKMCLLLLLLVFHLLPTSLAFCPDGCACDEDLLHVTCLRSKLEVRNSPISRNTKREMAKRQNTKRRTRDLAQKPARGKLKFSEEYQLSIFGDRE